MKWFTALTEGIRIAFDSLRSNRVRSGLTILGVTIGVAVVMVMAGAIQGINDSFTDALSSTGPKTFYVAHAQPSGIQVQGGFEEEEPAFLRNPPVDPDHASELMALPGIREASAIADLSGFGYRGRSGSESVTIALLAVSSSFLEIDDGDITDGRFLTAAEDRRSRRVAVVDSATAADVYRGGDPLGRNLEIAAGSPGSSGGSPFRVVGTYRPPANLFAGFLTHYVLVPFSAASRYVGFWDRMTNLAVRPEANTDLPVALDAVRGRMRQLRGLGPGEADDFVLITQDEILDLWNQLTAVLFTVMVALSSVGLMVGGIGVVGIMMISVTERTREIGVRKALGARRRDILWQFLVEAATLTVLGGAVGMLIGGGLVWAVAAFTPVPASVPLWAIAAALIASALTGIGFGLYPAARGARLDPVIALRYE